MYKNKKVLAVITARGGSKGLPGKNIRILCGKPLIAWTIEEALAARCVDRVIVSTDDPKIAAVSISYGAEVLMRPKSLAQDRSRSIDVLRHVVNVLKKDEGYAADIIVLLQPTSPLRTKDDIDNAVKIFEGTRCDSVVGVVKDNIYWGMKMSGKYIKPVFGWRSLKRRRQGLPVSYMPNGAVFVIGKNSLGRDDGLFTDKTIPYVMPGDRSVDIDTEADFEFAEFLMKRKR